MDLHEKTSSAEAPPQIVPAPEKESGHTPNRHQHKHIDPTALGLFGLALVTLVASMQKFGVFGDTISVMPWAVFLGSAAQIAAAVYDYKKGNAFGGLAFMAYGLFWAGMALSWHLGATQTALGFVFLGYLLFTAIMTLCSAKTNLVLFLIFCCIDVLFLFLTLSAFNVGYPATKYIAAGAELAIALLSFYGCAANITGIVFGKSILPIGKAIIK